MIFCMALSVIKDIFIDDVMGSDDLLEFFSSIFIITNIIILAICGLIVDIIIFPLEIIIIILFFIKRKLG